MPPHIQYMADKSVDRMVRGNECNNVQNKANHMEFPVRIHVFSHSSYTFSSTEWLRSMFDQNELSRGCTLFFRQFWWSKVGLIQFFIQLNTFYPYFFESLNDDKLPIAINSRCGLRTIISVVRSFRTGNQKSTSSLIQRLKTK